MAENGLSWQLKELNTSQNIYEAVLKWNILSAKWFEKYKCTGQNYGWSSYQISDSVRYCANIDNMLCPQYYCNNIACSKTIYNTKLWMHVHFFTEKNEENFVCHKECGFFLSWSGGHTCESKEMLLK